MSIVVNRSCRSILLSVCHFIFRFLIRFILHRAIMIPPALLFARVTQELVRDRSYRILLFQIFGVVVIMDFNGLSMKQVMGLTPSFSMKLLSFIQDAMPLRLKEVKFTKSSQHKRFQQFLNRIHLPALHNTPARHFNGSFCSRLHS